MKLVRTFGIFTLVGIFYCLQGCSDNKNDGQAAGATLANVEDASACLTQKNHICNMGLAFAQLGDSLASIQTTSVTANAKDTVYETEDMQWKGKVLTLPQGQILIEGTQVQKSDGEVDDANGGNVRAIRIQTPLFETVEQIKVGSKFAELKKIYADSLFEVQPAAYTGLLQLRLPSVSRITYFVNESATLPAAPGEENEVLSAKKISPEALIEMISVEE